MSVPSLDEAVAQAQKLGGMVVRPKSAVPNMGWFAVLLDPEHNAFAVWQDDPKAG